MNNSIYTFVGVVFLVALAPRQAFSMAPYICGSKEFIDCVDISEQQCIQATKVAFKLCSSTYALDDTTEDKTNAVITKVAKCVANQVWQIASVSEDDLERCELQFNTAAREEVERRKKERERLDDEFHKEYEPSSVH